MYVKFKGIVPSQYLWKCTRLGFPIMYFLGRKFAHVNACTYTHHTHTWKTLLILRHELAHHSHH